MTSDAMKLSDLYRRDSSPEAAMNTSVWIEYSSPVYFINEYHAASKRKRRRLRGKLKAKKRFIRLWERAYLKKG
jgi:hypothetical protein